MFLSKENADEKKENEVAFIVFCLFCFFCPDLQIRKDVDQNSAIISAHSVYNQNSYFVTVGKQDQWYLPFVYYVISMCSASERTYLRHIGKFFLLACFAERTVVTGIPS